MFIIYRCVAVTLQQGYIYIKVVSANWFPVNGNNNRVADAGLI